MLVAHDLMGAVYPHGRIDVDALAPRNLGGFGSDGPEVITRARSIKADALSHAALVAPLELSIEMTPAPAGAPSTALAKVVDHAGTPIAGVDVSVASTGPLMTNASNAMTGPDGTARFAYTAVVGENRLDATALLPDPVLHAFASTTHRAQRVAVPATVRLIAVAGFEVLAPTTTTSSTSTTTTVPPSTTTAPPPTTTTTTTSAPPATTAPSTTTVPTTTTVATTTTTAVAAHTATRSLPRTGGSSAALASMGLGLILVGSAVRAAGRRPD
jgi:hypothetical protein